jgi:hypothetical protein
MEWLWEKLVEQWGVVKAAPLPFGIAVILSVILVGVGIFRVVAWINREKVDTLKERISFLAERLDEQRQATRVAVENVANPKVAREAELRLLIYDDERNPTRISDTNIWRWVWIKHIDTRVTTGGTISRVTTLNILFISFETPMTTSAVEIRSPDFTLPPYEVNSFYPRFAIISFQGKMPAGTLEITMRP